MANKDLEKKIKNAFSKAVPDVLDSVMQQCSEQKGAVIEMTDKKSKRGFIYKIAAVAAALIVLLGGGFAVMMVAGGNGVETKVFFDVNPSVEILLNRDEKVIEAKALNADGEKIIGDMNFNGTDLDVSVNALIGSMLKNGYLSDIANSILISVDNDDPDKAAQLQQRLVDSINSIIGGASIDGSILSQTLSHDDKISKLADEYGISYSKAQLISDILEKNPLLTFEELAGSSINELNLLRESGGVKNKNLQVTGQPSTNGYIGEQAAWNAAVKHAAELESNSTLKSDILKLVSQGNNFKNPSDNGRVTMDMDDGKMVYEVEFRISGNSVEYDYDIDAENGSIVGYESEYDEDDRYSGSGSQGSSSQNNSSSSQSTGNSSDSKSYIGEAKAKRTALDHAGVAENSTSGMKVKLERENGRMVYDVSFNSGAYEYDYEIDAYSAAVYKSDKEYNDDYRQSTGGSSGSENNTASGSSQSYIGEAKAKRTALDHAGVAESSTSGMRVKLERENGRMVYDVSFNSGAYEYDYEIDAYSAAVYKSDKEYDDDYRQSTGGSSGSGNNNTASGSSQSYIGEAKAKQAAFNHAGVSSSNAYDVEVDLDRDDGVAVYEISFKSGGYEYDYEINAYTAAVLKNERERDD